MENVNNATFVQRLIALIIDIFLISCVVSLVSTFMVNTDNYNKLQKEATEVRNDYMDGKIKPNTYINKAMDINYDLSKQTALVTIVNIGFYILYFIVYQYKNNGQTLGKKLMKIRVVSNNDQELSINNFAIRSLMVDNIFIDMMILSITILGTKDMYGTGTMILGGIEYILLFIIGITVLSRKDKRGLHDLITNTKVIKEV